MYRKHFVFPCIAFGIAAVVSVQGIAATANSASTDGDRDDEPEIVGSIRVDRDLNPAEMVALTKISFESALHTALAAVPGHVIQAELEAEHHTLMYSFEIVNADGVVMEVEIDAGNGKVRDIDED